MKAKGSEYKEVNILAKARKLEQNGESMRLVKLAKFTNAIPAAYQAEMHLLLGKAFYDLKNFEKATTFLLKSLEYLEYLENYEHSNDTKWSIEVNLYLGVCHTEMASEEAAITYLENAIAIMDNTENPDDDKQIKQVANAYYHLAEAYRLSGNYDKALTASSKAIAFYEQITDIDNQASALLQQGALYNLKQQYFEAETTLYTALNFFVYSPGSTFLIQDVKQQLGIALLKQRKFADATQVLNEVYISYDESQNPEYNETDILSINFILGYCLLKWAACLPAAEQENALMRAEQFLLNAVSILQQEDLPVDELKSAFALIKWVTENEEFEPGYFSNAIRKLAKMIKGIEALDQKTECDNNERMYSSR